MQHTHSSHTMQHGPMLYDLSSFGAHNECRHCHVVLLFAGNICRSPTAEAMFRSVVENAGLADSFDIDSCGTGTGGGACRGKR
jgi:hypothetical protein